MSTKRKLPRRKLPWISNLLDHLPYSKLPTKLVYYNVSSLRSRVAILCLLPCQQELKALWAYAGYEDILMSNSNLVVEIRKLHKSYKDLLKFNVAKRQLPRPASCVIQHNSEVQNSPLLTPRRYGSMGRIPAVFSTSLHRQPPRPWEVPSLGRRATSTPSSDPAPTTMLGG